MEISQQVSCYFIAILFIHYLKGPSGSHHLPDDHADTQRSDEDSSDPVGPGKHHIKMTEKARQVL